MQDFIAIVSPFGVAVFEPSVEVVLPPPQAAKKIAEPIAKVNIAFSLGPLLKVNKYLSSTLYQNYARLKPSPNTS